MRNSIVWNGVLVHDVQLLGHAVAVTDLLNRPSPIGKLDAEMPGPPTITGLCLAAHSYGLALADTTLLTSLYVHQTRDKPKPSKPKRGKVHHVPMPPALAWARDE